jgi:16S rRNA C967 or C1407 C5-methylase (RsmB/RsmF family)
MPSCNNKSKSNNTLAVARGKNDARKLWHVKSGAGYRLFLDYYAAQPVGVVSNQSAATNTTTTKTCESQKNQGESGGFSRAAKRRKRKRGHDIVSSTESAAAEASTTTELQNSRPDAVTNHKLLELVLHSTKDSPNASDTHNYADYFKVLSTPLPVTVRIRQTLKAEQHENVQESLLAFGFTAVGASVFQHARSKHELRNEHELAYAFLQKHAGNGSLARQELASMLPAFALQPYISMESRILDVCAAPGSKTLQLLEGPHARVRANDVPARIQVLKDAVARSGVAFATKMKYSSQDARTYVINNNTPYTIIVCDVPCSGDGTARKDQHVLKSWTPTTANALHATQVSILLRAVHNVAAGGIVCYSTCSLNPVEDEAVVAAVLKQYGPKTCTLMDIIVSNHVAMTFRPGVTTWKVADYQYETADDSLDWYDSLEMAQQSNMQHAVPTLWPDANAVDLALHKCMRVWPQDNNTGGFFVALIKKM